MLYCKGCFIHQQILIISYFLSVCLLKNYLPLLSPDHVLQCYDFFLRNNFTKRLEMSVHFLEAFLPCESFPLSNTLKFIFESFLLFV